MNPSTPEPINPARGDSVLLQMQRHEITALRANLDNALALAVAQRNELRQLRQRVPSLGMQLQDAQTDAQVMKRQAEQLQEENARLQDYYDHAHHGEGL